ncbi:S35B4 protein, partial [Drymodes brunneopygia]|nr:S35B4 protein [Drymodes brunneopygia]
RQFPGCGNIVTFSQFLFIALEGFIFEANFGRKRPAIPIRYKSQDFPNLQFPFGMSIPGWGILTSCFGFFPDFVCFFQGSLIASMALGIIILKKRYSVSKYASIALVSLGIFTCTLMSAKQVASDSSLNQEDGPQVFLWWLLGIAALTFALLMSARMGIFQETLYQKFGKHSKEALFYNHALPLPGFLLLAPNIYQHAVLFNQSEPFRVPGIGLTLPIMWFYLLMNVITQYVCIRGVFILTTECTSLTVTLVVTLRKFVSLIFSILYFQNPFTGWHWLGTAFVFVGTLMYTEVWHCLGPLLTCSRRRRSRPKEE